MNVSKHEDGKYHIIVDEAQLEMIQMWVLHAAHFCEIKGYFAKADEAYAGHRSLFPRQ